MRRLAERRIEDAMRGGKFDNLAGAGKPLDLEPMPADENARMTWWMLRLLKNNNFTPDEVRWRRQIEKLKQELEVAMTEHRVDTLVRAINGLVRQINTMGTNAINIAVSPVSWHEERRRTIRACANDQCRSQNPTTAHFCRRCGNVLAW